MTPSIIIPVYNPPSTFSHLIQSICNLTSVPIIIIDDGSHPSIQIDPQYIHIKLLKNNRNKGKGFSLMKGFNYAYEQGFSHSITLDADSQHDPTLITDFLSMDNNISIVCGKRELKGSMPFHRRLSNIITSKIVSCICHTTIFDSQCGYRRYRLQDVCNEIFIEQGFQFETEVLIKLLRNGLKISHIPIPTIYLNESTNMRYLHDTLIFIKLLIRTIGKL